ncbi:hypothetical protein GCM10010234_31250 [Streptomyces hawaiiensis]
MRLGGWRLLLLAPPLEYTLLANPALHQLSVGVAGAPLSLLRGSYRVETPRPGGSVELAIPATTYSYL